MIKSRISNIDDAYDEVLRDLFTGYDRTKSVLKMIYEDKKYHIEFKNTEEKKYFFDILCQFSIPNDVKHIIETRYGLTTGKPLTLKELGNTLNLTDEGVRTKVRSAFRKMRHRINTRRTLERMVHKQ